MTSKNIQAMASRSYRTRISPKIEPPVDLSERYFAKQNERPMSGPLTRCHALRDHCNMRPALCFLLAATLLFGQSPTLEENLQRHLLEEMENQNVVANRVDKERRAAAFQDEEFCRRANRVAILWGQAVANHQAGRVDVKTMRELSKAFHDLEKSDGWISVTKSLTVATLPR